MRKEHDFLGEMQIPADALYGIHSRRAQENFPGTGLFHPEWLRAMGTVKQACYQVYQKFKHAAHTQYPNKEFPLRWIADNTMTALGQAALELSRGQHQDAFIVPALQGGAGTSINMNVNEILANRALQLTGNTPGMYTAIDPVEQANVFQSTNDVVPTALKVATMQLLNGLEEAINATRNETERLETTYRDALRLGYTQMQEAVPTSYGKLFSNYSDALSRDWWRVSKCFERIKVVNLGGSAIGTGITVPRFFIMEVVPALQRLTDLPLTRGENLTDTTSNLDSFVEIHGILKAHAVNLEKISTDLRLLSADVHGQAELKIPPRQAGSSIMPGKVNPVITEFVVSAAQQVYANDGLIASLAGRGCLELNAYLPLLGHRLLESLKLLIRANQSLTKNLLAGLTIDETSAREALFHSPAIATALLPYIGYHAAGTLAKLMQDKAIDIFQANKQLQTLPGDKLRSVLQPRQLLKLGFSLKEI